MERNVALLLLVVLATSCGDDAPVKSKLPENNSTTNNSTANNSSSNNTSSNNSISNNSSSNNSSSNNSTSNNSTSNNATNNTTNNATNNATNNTTNNATNNTTIVDTCGDGVVQFGEQCDGAPLVTCEDLGFQAGVVSCSTSCTHDISACGQGFCGDGDVQDGEICDDGMNNGEYGFCNASCTGLSGFCGDGAANGPEQCDGAVFTTCQALGFTGGLVSCTSQCTYNVSACTTCGDGVVAGNEVCDDGINNGTYGFCNTLCTGPGPRCGDGILNGNELCDTTTNASCSLVGGTGTASCSNQCTIDYSTCSFAPAPPAVGQIVITELMPDPLNRLDDDGEWFEVYNAGNTAANLEDCVFESSRTSGLESFVVMQTLVVQPGTFATLGRSGNVGFITNYNYNLLLNLNNTSDDLRLRCPVSAGSTQLRDIDYVTYQAPPVGASLSLSPPYNASTNDIWSNWCAATTMYITGDYGTPGTANPTCF